MKSKKHEIYRRLHTLHVQKTDKKDNIHQTKLLSSCFSNAIIDNNIFTKQNYIQEDYKIQNTKSPITKIMIIGTI